MVQKPFFFPCHKQGQGGVHGCAVLEVRKKSPAPSVGWVRDIQGWHSGDQELPEANAVLLGRLPFPIPPIYNYEHILRKEINAHLESSFILKAFLSHEVMEQQKPGGAASQIHHPSLQSTSCGYHRASSSPPTSRQHCVFT